MKKTIFNRLIVNLLWIYVAITIFLIPSIVMTILFESFGLNNTISKLITFAFIVLAMHPFIRLTEYISDNYIYKKEPKKWRQ